MCDASDCKAFYKGRYFREFRFKTYDCVSNASIHIDGLIDKSVNCFPVQFQWCNACKKKCFGNFTKCARCYRYMFDDGIQVNPNSKDQWCRICIDVQDILPDNQFKDNKEKTKIWRQFVKISIDPNLDRHQLKRHAIYNARDRIHFSDQLKEKAKKNESERILNKNFECLKRCFFSSENENPSDEKIRSISKRMKYELPESSTAYSILNEHLFIH